MDKILSARVDESVIQRIGSLARQLNTTKKKIIEGAITLYAEKIEKGNEKRHIGADVWRLAKR